jgi:WD40 repeat protein
LAFSPRGRTLAAGNSDGIVVFWDPDSAKERDASRAHPEPVTSMAFLPDTSALMSGSSDGTLKLWRARPPAFPPIAALPATDGKNCRFVTFSRDGMWLIAGGITKII